MMQETASIIPVCPNGFSPQVVRDVVLDKPVNTCVANKSKTAEVVCPSGWVSGGANGQQCRHETSPDAYGICPNGYTKSSGQCVTAWRFEAPSQYVCSDLCNIDLSNPLSTCPADQDPIA
ncbi:hypothetical protein OH460_08860 [Vibrio sp. Makdt]|uniref:hypothetical protein n=1 Tax=Vibrio sp. Makdt TaxID=2998828 RepID=UPI0022CD59E1|nr:hypothetical protein [Vibrio sp. Makdt]MDA0152411.1 hypothetical protein [Vibrio sp. Makdt]